MLGCIKAVLRFDGPDGGSTHNHAFKTACLPAHRERLACTSGKAHASIDLFTHRAALCPGNQCVGTSFQNNNCSNQSCSGVKKTAASAPLRHHHFMCPIREPGLLKIHRKLPSAISEKVQKDGKGTRRKCPKSKANVYAACGIWRANIPSRTGIISDRTLPSAVSARTCPRNPSMAPALAAVFSDTAGISPALYCAVNPR